MRYIIFSLLVLTLAACGGQNDKSAPTAAAPQPFYCDEIVKAEEFAEEADPSTYMLTKIEKATIIEKCLCVNYSYSGCRETARLMIWDGTFNESNRPEVELQLLTPKAGMCEMLIQDSACFSLKQMQLVGNQVLIKVNNKEEKLLVNFSGEPIMED